MKVLWSVTRWSNFDPAAPFEAGRTTNVGTTQPIHVPAQGTNKVFARSTGYPLIGAKMAATGGAVNAPTPWSAAWTRVRNTCPTAAPFDGSLYFGSGQETTPTSDPLAPAVDVTLSRETASWVAVMDVIKAATSGSTPQRNDNGTGNLSDPSVITVTIPSSATGALLIVDIEIDDPTRIVTPPAGGAWTAMPKVSGTGFYVQRFWRIAADATTVSFDFTLDSSVAPTNTVPPVVSGVGVIGSTLTSSAGTWANSPVSYAYQWLADGVPIFGATNSSYDLATGDFGKTFTCQVIATNGSGSSAPVASSNGITVPNPPVNTSLPTMTPSSGPYHSGDHVTASSGSWSDPAATITYQWFRNTNPITGATLPGYDLAVTDEGATIFCRVTAANGGGSTSADSPSIVPAQTAPISDASFLMRYSGGSGNQDPAASIGGARGATYPGGLSAILGPISGTPRQLGGTYYRALYVQNTHPSSTALTGKLYVEQQFVSGLQVQVGVPVEAAGVALPTLTDGVTPPAGVAFSAPVNPAGGLDFGSLGPNGWRGVWLKFVVPPNAVGTNEDDFVVTVEFQGA